MARRDLYKVLQVDPEAEPEVVQAAYRRLARKYHPDVASDATAAASAAARMSEINEAWEVLGDPHRRAAYDADRNASMHAQRDTRAWPGGSGRSAPAPGREPAATWGARPTAGGWAGGRATPPADRGFRAPPEGSAGPAPGNPSGSVLNFGRYAGWSLGEIARHDPDFLEQLDRLPIGRRYRDEIDGILRRLGRRGAPGTEAGRFRRR